MDRTKAIVAVGMFDGVHAGHRYILDFLKAKADELGLTPVVVTFSNHPLSVIRPDRVPPVLTTPRQRLDFIREAGIDNVIMTPFDENLRKLTAARFITDFLQPRIDVKAVVLGYDNNFGSDRMTELQDYRRSLEPLGVEVFKCSRFPERQVSSTLIRRALADGEVALANAMTGRPYTLGGMVVTGKQLGRTIGFPTANIAPDAPVILREGVYAAQVIEPLPLAGLPAMLNIGRAPTVNGDGTLTVEAHIILPDKTSGVQNLPTGATLDLYGEKTTLAKLDLYGEKPTRAALDLYGEKLTLAVLERLRDERRFDSLDALRQALADDRARTIRIVAQSPRKF